NISHVIPPIFFDKREKYNFSLLFLIIRKILTQKGRSSKLSLLSFCELLKFSKSNITTFTNDFLSSPSPVVVLLILPLIILILSFVDNANAGSFALPTNITNQFEFMYLPSLSFSLVEILPFTKLPLSSTLHTVAYPSLIINI